MTELLTTHIGSDTLTRLHARLVTEAGADLDIGYRTVDSPLGTLLLAATGQGVVRIGFVATGDTEVLQELAGRISPRILRDPTRVDRLATELDEYFAGSRRTFDVPLDLRLARGFRLEVIRHLNDIGYGQTMSYAAVAALAGNPNAVRAVGTACALNPLPLVLPCHRVVRSDGSTGQYAGGADAKRALLALEAAPGAVSD